MFFSVQSLEQQMAVHFSVVWNWWNGWRKHWYSSKCSGLFCEP